MEIASNALGSNNNNLFKADRILEFLKAESGKNTSSFGIKLHNNLENRIIQRRNLQVAGLIRYLSSNGTTDSTLQYPSKTELGKAARDIFFRLFKPNIVSNNESESPSEADPAPAAPVLKKSKMEELNSFLQETSSPRTPQASFQTAAEVLVEIKREMAIFESTGQRPACLEKVYSALITLPPTSVEAERVFSAAGLFITKIRTRLNDEAIDSLCFLRRHFLNLKK